MAALRSHSQVGANLLFSYFQLLQHPKYGLWAAPNLRAEMVQECINKCDVDLRKDLYQVCSGTSLFVLAPSPG